MTEQRKGLVISAVHKPVKEWEVIRMAINFSPRRSGHVFVPLNKEQLAATGRFYGVELPGSFKVGPEGTCTVHVLHDEHKIQWITFFPFGVGKGSDATPKKIGIGPLVHYAITEYLAKRHKLEGYNVTHNHDASEERIKQLELMGIDTKVPYPFPRYREIVRQAIVKRFGAEPALEMP